jgi:prevent-host-death family protein
MHESPQRVTTNGLRRSLSEFLNRAAFGSEPVVVTRRGRPIVALISCDDLAFLRRMRKRQHEVRSRPLPSDAEQVGPALAARLREELFFDL